MELCERFQNIFYGHPLNMVLITKIYEEEFVVTKAKGRISKRALQENKTHQIFRKTNIFNPLIRMCAYQGVRNVRFSENLVCFVFL